MPELGSKHECPNCGTKFYDLGRPEPLCPKCGTNVRLAKPNEPASSSQAARKRRKTDLAADSDELTADSVEVPETPLDDEDTADLEDDEDDAEDLVDLDD